MIPNIAPTIIFPEETILTEEDFPGFSPAPRIIFFAAKRVLDILISLVLMLLVMAWLIPILAVLIKWDSRGPVFFRQKRIGKKGRIFTCYKFRTMFMNSEADRKPATENDSRITRIGHFLRASNLDELPQLINVLEGSMSLVGPRPHMLADVNRFSSMISGYEFRSLVKPGITGPAQVRGFYGPSYDLKSIYGRFLHDAYYVRNASLSLDLQTIWETGTQRTSFLYAFLKNRLRKRS